MNTCYKCGHEIKLEIHQKIQRSDECPKCYTDLRCCMMCNFYDKNSYNECREPTADRIVDKEKKNFCDFFSFGNKAEINKKVEDAKALAESLFKKG